MKGLLIENGVFIFETQRERCKNVERIGNTIEMSNVTIFNTENVALNVNAVLMCLLKSLSAVTLHGRNLSCLNLEEAC